jgi:hypothetical protein
VSEPDWIARGVAIIALVISAVSAAWNIRKDVRDRGLFKLTVRFKDIAKPDYETKRPPVIFTITNVGRRALILAKYGGTTDSGKFIIKDENLPKKLEPGEQYVGVSDELKDISVHSLQNLFAIDSLERRYDAPSREVLRISAWYVEQIDHNFKKISKVVPKNIVFED